MSVERSCEICGTSDAGPLYEVAGYPIVRCRVCGLVYVGREVAEEELVTLYDEGYYEDDVVPGYDGYAAAELRKREHNRTLLAALEKLIEVGKLLEVGCAYGFFLAEARDRGWQVRGFEPSEYAAAQAKERFGLEVVSAALPRRSEADEQVDAVAMWDVIEHLPHPAETLSAAASWLRPGGVLALSTGDIASVSARLHGPDWSLMTPPWHQFYFSRKTMARLLASCGLEVLKISGDGTVAVDPGSKRPRISGRAAEIMLSPLVTRAARRLGAGSIMYVFARSSR